MASSLEDVDAAWSDAGGFAVDLLRSIQTPTDCLDVSPDGDLLVDGHSAASIVSEYGSPVYVISETTIRQNFRRVREAFESSWKADVTIMYAIKANNNLAVRRIISSEGGGGDCFGEGELYASIEGGADPAKLALNGSNKQDVELRRAIELGIRINIDGDDEVDRIVSLCTELGRVAHVGLRLKPLPQLFLSFTEAADGVAGDRLFERIADEKWGFSFEAACGIVERIRAQRELVLDGYHVHMGRLGQSPRIQEAWCAELASGIAAIHRETGYAPRVVDIGGGWARERDPESGRLGRNEHSIEEYAAVVAKVLGGGLEAAGIGIPDLGVEPGRYIVGNAGVLVGTVGSVKEDIGRVWVNVDFSTNNLTRIDSQGYCYHLLPADRMSRKLEIDATVVGGTCTLSVIAPDRRLPKLSRGDLVAVLDAGMYSETTSNQYNGMARPATVLVRGEDIDCIKIREQAPELFAGHRVPSWLA